MANTVSVDRLANVIMHGLTEYADAQSDMVKQSVKDVSKEVKKEISANAPKRTGAYKKSWATKKTKETSNSLTMTVHSKNMERQCYSRKLKGDYGNDTSGSNDNACGDESSVCI